MTMELFNVSEDSVKQARKLKMEKIILANPRKYSREGIDRASKSLVTEFYSILCSCIWPGKKDCVSIKLDDGSKEKVKRRLLLINFTEI